MGCFSSVNRRDAPAAPMTSAQLHLSSQGLLGGLEGAHQPRCSSPKRIFLPDKSPSCVKRWIALLSDGVPSQQGELLTSLLRAESGWAAPKVMKKSTCRWRLLKDVISLLLGGRFIVSCSNRRLWSKTKMTVAFLSHSHFGFAPFGFALFRTTWPRRGRTLTFIRTFKNEKKNDRNKCFSLKLLFVEVWCSCSCYTMMMFDWF